MTTFSLDDYDFELPPELIAQYPSPRREDSRLLILDLPRDRLVDGVFPDLLSLLAPGDLLVFNNTKVFPARLLGHKESGGKVELLLLEYPQSVAKANGANGIEIGKTGGGGSPEKTKVDQVASEGSENNRQLHHFKAQALLKGAKAKIGTRLLFADDCWAEVAELGENGAVRVILHCTGDQETEAKVVLEACLDRYGQVPLPPYIRRPEETSSRDATSAMDSQRYQTVYAEVTGAVAAPTAGLHFTNELLAKIQGQGVNLAQITLHVGYGTFAPVRCADIREHDIHAEYYSITEQNAALVNQTKAAGGRIWAVGTTSVRALEEAGANETGKTAGMISPGSGMVKLYIYPGYRYRVVDNLLTNFHLPRSSLLFMISALAGRERILAAYAHAVKQGYRFFSYGDAMAIRTK